MMFYTQLLYVLNLVWYVLVYSYVNVTMLKKGMLELYPTIRFVIRILFFLKECIPIPLGIYILTLFTGT
jgi:hypothetical protein